MHDKDCDFHCEQYEWECTCGVTNKRTESFDEFVRKRDGDNNQLSKAIEPTGDPAI